LSVRRVKRQRRRRVFQAIPPRGGGRGRSRLSLRACGTPLISPCPLPLPARLPSLGASSPCVLQINVKLCATETSAPGPKRRVLLRAGFEAVDDVPLERLIQAGGGGAELRDLRSFILCLLLCLIFRTPSHPTANSLHMRQLSREDCPSRGRLGRARRRTARARSSAMLTRALLLQGYLAQRVVRSRETV